jgi:GNAT superfamily N-acetyltransferase
VTVVADVSVRPARPEDAERLAAVQLSTWRTAYDFLPDDALDVPPEQAAALWLRAIELPPTPTHRVLVAMDGAELVGFAASGPAEDDDVEADIGTVEVSTLLVEPRWGRRGHGSRLLAATVDHWREDGATTAVSWVWERDAASRAFLTAAGWEPDGAARGMDTGPRIERQVRLHADVSA